MPRYLDMAAWNRREHFAFFKDYDSPFFNICAQMDVTNLRVLTRRAPEYSFSLAYHFISTKIANELESFRYRRRGDQVLVHDKIHAGSIIMLDDERFTFV